MSAPSRTRRTTARRCPRRYLAGERPDLSLRPRHVARRPRRRAAHGTTRARRRPRRPGETLLRPAADRHRREPGELPALAGRANVHVLRTLDDALRLDAALAASEHIAIVGAGLIGQEVASSAVARGVQRHADRRRRPTRSTRSWARAAATTCRRCTSAPASSSGSAAAWSACRRSWTRAALHLDDGSRVEPDLVLVAVGVRPATEWTPWPAGIPVDAAGRTPIAERLRRRRRDRRQRPLGGRRPPGPERRARDARPAPTRRACRRSSGPTSTASASSAIGDPRGATNLRGLTPLCTPATAGSPPSCS